MILIQHIGLFLFFRRRSQKPKTKYSAVNLIFPHHNIPVIFWRINGLDNDVAILSTKPRCTISGSYDFYSFEKKFDSHFNIS